MATPNAAAGAAGSSQLSGPWILPVPVALSCSKATVLPAPRKDSFRFRKVFCPLLLVDWRLLFTNFLHTAVQLARFLPFRL